MLFQWTCTWKHCGNWFSGGAGGKGVWGKPGSELVEEDVDRNDPNYESDSLENGDIELKTIIPETSSEEIRVGLYLHLTVTNSKSQIVSSSRGLPKNVV